MAKQVNVVSERDGTVFYWQARFEGKWHTGEDGTQSAWAEIKLNSRLVVHLSDRKFEHYHLRAQGRFTLPKGAQATIDIIGDDSRSKNEVYQVEVAHEPFPPLPECRDVGDITGMATIPA